MSEPVFTLSQLIDEVSREIRMRRQVYPGLITRKRMTEAQADRQIAAMGRIEDILLVLRDDDKIQALVRERLGEKEKA